MVLKKDCTRLRVMTIYFVLFYKQPQMRPPGILVKHQNEHFLCQLSCMGKKNVTRRAPAWTVASAWEGNHPGSCSNCSRVVCGDWRSPLLLIVATETGSQCRGWSSRAWAQATSGHSGNNAPSSSHRSALRVLGCLCVWACVQSALSDQREHWPVFWCSASALLNWHAGPLSQRLLLMKPMLSELRGISPKFTVSDSHLWLAFFIFFSQHGFAVFCLNEITGLPNFLFFIFHFKEFIFFSFFWSEKNKNKNALQT